MTRSAKIAVARINIALFAIAVHCGGCAIHHVIARDLNSYLLYSDHRKCNCHVFAIGTEHPPLPAPFLINVIISDVDPAEQDAHLIQHLLRHDADLDLNDDLFHRIVALTAEFPRDRIRWLVGVRPLVIAIGATDDAAAIVSEGATLHKGETVQIGAAIRLVTESDLTQTVYAVVRAHAGDKRSADITPAQVDHVPNGLSLAELYQKLATEWRSTAAVRASWRPEKVTL